MQLSVSLLFLLVAAATGCPRIISKDEWGARPPVEEPTYIPDDLPYLYIHHSAGPFCDSEETCSSVVRGIQNYDMDAKGYNDIGYSFMIGGDGNIYEGRGWNVWGAHSTDPWNSIGYGICFLGYFVDENPVQAAQDAYFQLADCAVSLGKLMPEYVMYGHRQVYATACPGQSFYDLIQTWPHWAE